MTQYGLFYCAAAVRDLISRGKPIQYGRVNFKFWWGCFLTSLKNYWGCCEWSDLLLFIQYGVQLKSQLTIWSQNEDSCIVGDLSSRVLYWFCRGCIILLRRNPCTFINLIETHPVGSLFSMKIRRYLTFFVIIRHLSRSLPSDLMGENLMWEVVNFDFNIEKQKPLEGIPSSTVLGNQPLYISITTIRSRIR